MSGIGGIIRFGRRNASSAAGPMAASLSQRSAQVGLQTANGAALLQGCSPTGSGPQGAPYRDGGLIVIADARLDDQLDLARRLGLDKAQAHQTLAVLAAAWRRWGVETPSNLEGEFAFAVWDEAEASLFCARDRFGIKPFYYSDQDGFAFASSQGALLGAGVDRAVDEARIADYLVGLPFAQDQTVYRSIRRLAPGSWLRARKDGVQIGRYYALEARTPQARSDAVEAFGALFEDAVARRLDQGAGVMLSGGLDSSSIAAAAARCAAKDPCPPVALSMVFEGRPEVDERRHIEAVLEGRMLRAQWLSSQDVALLDDLEEIVEQQGAPYQAPTHHFSRHLYVAAREQGARVVLDGHGGDETVSFGYGRLSELARDGKWLTLWREASGVAQTFGVSASELFAAYAGAVGPGRLARRFVARLSPRVRTDGTAWRRAVDPNLALRCGLVDRWRQHVAHAPATCADEASLHHRTLTQANHSAAFEVLDQAASAAGVEARYPFWDRRLVEFCLSLESVEKLRGGYARRILRQSMASVLPDSVRLRRDKVDFRPQVARSLTARPEQMSQLLAARANPLVQYANLEVVRAAWQRVLSDPAVADGEDVLMVWRAAVLAAWLRTQEAGRPTADKRPLRMMMETIR